MEFVYYSKPGLIVVIDIDVKKEFEEKAKAILSEIIEFYLVNWTLPKWIEAKELLLKTEKVVQFNPEFFHYRNRFFELYDSYRELPKTKKDLSN